MQADAPARVKQVQRFMGPRYREAYVKGVSDHDAALILFQLLEMNASVGLLRFHTQRQRQTRLPLLYREDVATSEGREETKVEVDGSEPGVGPLG